MSNLIANSDSNESMSQQLATTLNGELSSSRSLHARQLSTGADPNLLPIMGGALPPQSVNVNLTFTGTSKLLSFTIPTGSPPFTDGIEWSFPKGTESALFIFFNFTSPLIKEITCDYSQVAYGAVDNITQLVSVQPSNDKGTFHFKVHLTTGDIIDPKIKITPT